MSDVNELDAAERALGHAPAGRETSAEAMARESWERRLAPLLATAPRVEPSASLFSRIETEIAPATGAPSVRPVAAAPDTQEATSIIKIADIAAARASAGRWRGVAGAFGAIAAALAIYIAVPNLIGSAPVETAAAPAKERYVAVVSADDGSGAGLIIQIDAATGDATVIPVTAPPAGSSYEMWTIPDGGTTPVSLGLLPQAAVARDGMAAAAGQVFAISLEPEGGSPNGQPTQALFHGKAVRID